MRVNVAAKALAALLLIAGAAAARTEAGAARAEAEAWHGLLTFQYDEAPAAAASSLGQTLADPDAGKRREATVDYWLGRYDALAERGADSADPELLFIAANAAYRAAWREAAGPDGLKKLDQVIQAYAGVLKANPGHADAAFNLELVARRRDQLARQKPVQLVSGEPEASGPVLTTDLPVGPTIHGVPGGPPMNIPVEEFEVLIPRESGDEQAPPGQAAGGKLRRKG